MATDSFVTHVRRDCTELGSAPKGEAVEQSREMVISQIERGRPFSTAYIKNGRIEEGAQIPVIVIQGRRWLRTDANKVEADNLGNLPLF